MKKKAAYMLLRNKEINPEEITKMLKWLSLKVETKKGRFL